MVAPIGEDATRGAAIPSRRGEDEVGTTEDSTYTDLGTRAKGAAAATAVGARVEEPRENPPPDVRFDRVRREQGQKPYDDIT